MQSKSGLIPSVQVKHQGTLYIMHPINSDILNNSEEFGAIDENSLSNIIYLDF